MDRECNGRNERMSLVVIDLANYISYCSLPLNNAGWSRGGIYLSGETGVRNDLRVGVCTLVVFVWIY